jgi:hypothetical protein
VVLLDGLDALRPGGGDHAGEARPDEDCGDDVAGSRVVLDDDSYPRERGRNAQR